MIAKNPIEKSGLSAGSNGTSVTGVQSAHRLPQLDFLRGIAILLVLGVHQPFFEAGKLRLISGLLGRFGWSGVDLFFVLSGFLIGGLIFREIVTKQSFDMRRFYIRRVLKIWPLYYLYVFVIAAILFAQKGSAFGHYFITVIVPAIFNYQNLSPAFAENLGYIWIPMGMTWSLAVEEHFYLLLPLCCLLALAVRPPAQALKIIALGCIACIITCTVLRFVLLWKAPFSYFTHLWPTYLRIDGLAFGVLLAYVYHAQPTWWEGLKKYRYLILISSLALLFPMVLLSHERSRFVWTIGYTFLYLGYGGLLVVLMQTTVGKGKIGSFIGSAAGKGIAAIGRASYSIYLWQLLLAGKLIVHYQYLIPFKSNLALHWLVAFILSVSLSIVEGMVIARLIEVPTLVIRNRLFPARSEAVRSTSISQE